MNLEKSIDTLGVALGAPLVVDEINTAAEHGMATATAHATIKLSEVLQLQFVVKILVSDCSISEPRTWALVFFFVNRRRVAPADFSHATLSYDVEGQVWHFRDWEVDAFDEWGDLNISWLDA
jgi:hypothetical protein